MIDECNRRLAAEDILADRSTVRTDRLDLRPSDGSYLEELVGLWSDPRVAELTTLRVPQPRPQVLEMVESSRIWWEEDGLGPFDAIERETGAWVGRVGLWRLSDWAGPERYEVGFEIAPAFWRRGFASEAGRAVVHFGFAHGLPRIISVTVAENAGSRATMERCGLALAGTRVWNGCDVVWYAIDRPDATDMPEEEHARID
jgi:[ribosomal protein S5]-alanine N-acetyltransferase